MLDVRRGIEEQRQGMLNILTGKETDPFSTFWAVYAAMCETILPPVHTRITIDLDMRARRATCTADNIATGRGEPILNPVNGTEHRAGIVLPNGFEYGQNEVGRGWSTSTGGAPPGCCWVCCWVCGARSACTGVRSRSLVQAPEAASAMHVAPRIARARA